MVTAMKGCQAPQRLEASWTIAHRLLRGVEVFRDWPPWSTDRHGQSTNVRGTPASPVALPGNAFVAVVKGCRQQHDAAAHPTRPLEEYRPAVSTGRRKLSCALEPAHPAYAARREVRMVEPIHQEVAIDAAPADVYAALTEASRKGATSSSHRAAASSRHGA